MQRRPTIRDVARAAGVGASTVSLALRNDPRLRPAMRERVQKVAEEIGYLPDATLASLMAQLRAGQEARFQATLGFVNASEDPVLLREFSTFREWIRGATERARELGYGMDFFWLQEPGVTAARMREILEARGIRGLIVAGMQNDGVLPAAHSELWPYFTTVVIGMRPKTPALHFTANDQFLTARLGVEALQRLNYQRIALAIDRRIDGWLEERFSAGYFSGIKKGESNFNEIFDFRTNGFDAFAEWFQQHRPEALLTLHVEVERWLQKLEQRVPEDVGLVHLDRELEMTHWAGMDQNNYCIGASATDMVVGALHRNEVGIPKFARSITLQSTWVAGETVRAQESKKPRTERGFSVRGETFVRRGGAAPGNKPPAGPDPRRAQSLKAPARR